MSDLVEKLRNAAACIDGRYPDSLLRESADEIERLREAMKGASIIATTSGLLLEANEVEIKRLREQLVKSNEPFGYLLEKAGINNGYYFLSVAEYQSMEERFREHLIPVFTKTDEEGK